MYLAIDVGGSKTLFAVFTPEGELVFEHKIVTNPNYQLFLKDIETALSGELKNYNFEYCCCAAPGLIDHQADVVKVFGNLAWRNVPLKNDLQQLMPNVKVLILNDAKLAGLSEAKLVKAQYKKVLYVTLSTGIGGGVIENGLIPAQYLDMEPGWARFQFNGTDQKWESFASGRALKQRYGKLASEIDDPAIWREYARNLAIGFKDLLVQVQPDVVIIGGGVGAYFEKFKPLLEAELRKVMPPLALPPLLKARRPEEAVIYGCYEYIKQQS